MLDALTAEGRAPALIILDNKSALTGGTDEIQTLSRTDS